MARTIAQIYSGMVAEKNTYANLSTLAPTGSDDLPTVLRDVGSTPSSVGVWRLLFYLFSFGAWTLETLWDVFLAAVNALIAAQQVPTLQWYKTQAFAFQYGDGLVFVNGKYQYAVVDPSHQIVARCAALEDANQVRIKVAMIISGSLAQMPSPQLAALQSYFQRIKPGGVNAVCVSFSPDKLRIPVTVYYDPLILTPTGESILTPGTFPIEDAINAYIAQISGVTNPELFNGKFNLTKLDDAIQQATGVVDLTLGNVQGQYGSLAFATITRDYQTNAGWCIVDPAYSLSTSITYVSNV